MHFSIEFLSVSPHPERPDETGKGVHPKKIQAPEQLGVGCALGAPSWLLHGGITLHRHQKNSKGHPEVLEKSAPHPPPPPTPHPFCPLGTASNPEEKPSSEAHRDLHLSGLPVAAGAARLWSRGAEDRFPPRASRPPLRPQTSPEAEPRRQGSPGGRAPSDPGARPSSPVPFSAPLP